MDGLQLGIDGRSSGALVEPLPHRPHCSDPITEPLLRRRVEGLETTASRAAGEKEVADGAQPPSIHGRRVGRS